MSWKPSNEFEVRNTEIEALIKELGETLRNSMPPGGGWVFSLIVASVGKGGSCFYTSNCNREDMVNLMKEFIERNRLQ